CALNAAACRKAVNGMCAFLRNSSSERGLTALSQQARGQLATASATVEQKLGRNWDTESDDKYRLPVTHTPSQNGSHIRHFCILHYTISYFSRTIASPAEAGHYDAKSR